MRRRRGSGPAVDLRTTVGSVSFTNPVMTASGTAGHGDELGRYVDLAALGAVVTKSQSVNDWPGNPAPRVHETPSGMLNSVGLQGRGVEHWLETDLPPLLAAGARVVASIWGRTVEEYAGAASLLADAPVGVVAVEVNLSCPNLAGKAMFAQQPSAAAEAIEAAAACRRPLWAKLTPNVTDLVAVAEAAHRAGAEAVTLINTVLGMIIDVEARRPLLGGHGGGLSGPAIHPVAVRAVHDVRAALPDLPIVGVGGVDSGVDAVELMMAGANAVQVGAATFADPRAPARVRDELEAWCRSHGVPRASDLVNAAHS